MKKNLTRLSAALLAVLLCAAFASCQLSEIGGKDTESGTDTVTDSVTTAADWTTIEDVEPMDLMNMDLSPYITLGQYKGVKVNEASSTPTDEMLEERISALLEAAGEYTRITDRAAADGDVLNINYVGYMDGAAFEGGSADDQSITLSDESGFIDGFAEGLVGAMPGSTVRLELTFPEDYYEDVAGKAVSFDVTVNYIQGDLIVPEFNDVFAAENSGGEFTTAEAYRAEILRLLGEELKESVKSDATDEIWYIVLENAEITEYPEQQVNYYFNMIKSQYASYGSGSGLDLATLLSYFGLTQDDLLSDAKSYVETDLVLYSIIKAEQITLTDEEFQAGLEDYAASYEVTPDELLEYYGEATVRESLIKDKAFLLLYDWADITVVS